MELNGQEYANWERKEKCGLQNHLHELKQCLLLKDRQKEHGRRYLDLKDQQGHRKNRLQGRQSRQNDQDLRKHQKAQQKYALTGRATAKKQCNFSKLSYLLTFNYTIKYNTLSQQINLRVFFLSVFL